MSDKETYGFGEYSVTEINHYPLQLAEGVKLSAKLWIPDKRGSDASFTNPNFHCFNDTTYNVLLIDETDNETKETFPAILEYLPYCKDMYTTERDYNRHSWFASHGFVSMRVQIRGTGTSEGFYYGEYLPQEQADCSEVLQLIAALPWSNGKVGMYGKSWGGFNGLQMAYREGEESPLKTVISLYSTDSRYTDDIHYQGGCVVGSGMLSWAGEMFARNAVPPPPAAFSEKKAWLRAYVERLDRACKSDASSWLNHQLPDKFWDHGSVCKDYGKITVPVLVIGGLEDGYTTAAERLARKLNPQSKVIIGPWCHDWPDCSTTGRLIDYLTMCLQWFTLHLKGAHVEPSDKCTAWPRLQLCIRDSFNPSEVISDKSLGAKIYGFGDWVKKSAEVEAAMMGRIHGYGCDPSPLLITLYFSNEGRAVFEQPTTEQAPVLLTSHALQGSHCGVWCPFGTPTCFTGDQATSIAHSVSFYTSELEGRLVILGAPKFVLTLTASCWKRVYISVKVSDMSPEGVATLITRCQYDLNYLTPISQTSSKRTYVLPMLVTSQAVAAGHRLVVSVSPNAWPMLWPSSVPSTLALHPEGCKLLLQTESEDYLAKNLIKFNAPRPLFPMPKEELSRDKPVVDIKTIGDKVIYQYNSPGLNHLLHTNNVWYKNTTCETYETDLAVTYAVATIEKEYTSVFDRLRFTDCEDSQVGVRVVTHQVMRGDGEVYTLEEGLKVSWEESGEEIFSKSWSDVIARQDHGRW